MTFTLTIPTPGTLLQYTWFAMGIAFGRGFGKELDQSIQNSEWFANLPAWQKEVVKRTLDCFHHWWIGLLLVNYSNFTEAIWFGWGLVTSDAPDLPARFGINWLKDRMYGKSEPEPRRPHRHI